MITIEDDSDGEYSSVECETLNYPSAEGLKKGLQGVDHARNKLKDAQNTFSGNSMLESGVSLKNGVLNGIRIGSVDVQRQKATNSVDNVDCPESTNSVETLNSIGSPGKENTIKDGADEKASNRTNDMSTLRSQESVECIELDDDADDDEDDDDERGSSAPPLKRVKNDRSTEESDLQGVGKKPELTNSEALLNKVEAYVREAIESGVNAERKVLDALLGAINIQVQQEPLSVRKLILEKQLVLPNTISFPPSQVVDLLIEHDPDDSLSRVIRRMFGDERPKFSEPEKRERHLLKLGHPAPNMTKFLIDIGQDLVQESTYSDIVHGKNLPETPKKIQVYKQVAKQLKPVWEVLRKKNEPYKLKQIACQLCNYKTESRLVLALHRQTPHFDGRKYQCALCPEFFTNENMISQHYLRQHELIAGKEEQIPRNPCPCCNEDFMYKGQRDQHLKMCRRDPNRVRLIMAPNHPYDVSSVNQWLWDKPPVDPTILQQQQISHRQQAEKMQRAQTAQQQQLQQQRRNPAIVQSTLLRQQKKAAMILQQQQQRRRPAAHVAVQHQQQAKMSSIMNCPGIFAAMQQQPQRAAAGGLRTPSIGSFSRPVTFGIRPATLQQNATLGGRVRVPTQAGNARTKVGSASTDPNQNNTCEICDQNFMDRARYLSHLQLFHKQMNGKTAADMQQGAPLACSRCRDRFWTYEGLERHLVMAHGLVTSDLLTKAQKKEDGGRCNHCGKQYAFNMLQHLVTDHQVKLCSAEIMYSCDLCAFKCSSYNKLEAHLSTVHPKTSLSAANSSGSFANSATRKA